MTTASVDAANIIETDIGAGKKSAIAMYAVKRMVSPKSYVFICIFPFLVRNATLLFVHGASVPNEGRTNDFRRDFPGVDLNTHIRA